MKKIFLLCALVAGTGNYHIIAQDQTNYTVAEISDDLVAQLEDMPAELLKPRELPWYLRVISKPGVYVFIKSCEFCDWVHESSIAMYKQASRLVYLGHNKEKNETNLPLKEYK